MQRRVATIYLVFFLIMGASAYSIVGVAQPPEMELPGEQLAVGDTLSLEGETYTVSSLDIEEGDHGGEATATGELVWTSEAAQFNDQLANGTELSPVQLAVDGQQARHTATIAPDETVRYEERPAQLRVTAAEETAALVNETGVRAELSVGDSLSYEGNTTTVAEISERGARLVWGDDYRLAASSESARFVQVFDVSARLAADPAVEEEPVTRADGQQYVVYQANGSTVPLTRYLPARDTVDLQEGDRLRYEGERARISDVTAEAVSLSWTAPRTDSAELEEGANVTLESTVHVVHFPDAEHVVISPAVEEYLETTERQAQFQQRMSGFWGITIVSGVATILIVALAFMPIKD